MNKKTIKKAIALVNLLFISLLLASFVSNNGQNSGGEITGNNNLPPQNATTTGGVFQPNQFQDRTYINENTPSRRVIKYTHLRQADVANEKRVWRRLDLREKINLPLIFPTAEDLNGFQNRKSFFDIVKDGVLSGQITLFRDDEFKEPRLGPPDSLKKYFSFEFERKFKSVVDGTDSVDANGAPVTKKEYQEYLSSQILTVDIKEDWFFDKQRSVLDVRILGIGFSVEKEIAPGKFGYEVIGWIYYPQCRPYFARNEIYNPKNDSERRTLEDFFWKRMFNSFITRESNVFNRDIETYAKGLDAIIESDRIKGDLYKWENDLWHY